MGRVEEAYRFRHCQSLNVERRDIIIDSLQFVPSQNIPQVLTCICLLHENVTRVLVLVLGAGALALNSTQTQPQIVRQLRAVHDHASSPEAPDYIPPTSPPPRSLPIHYLPFTLYPGRGPGRRRRSSFSLFLT